VTNADKIKLHPAYQLSACGTDQFYAAKTVAAIAIQHRPTSSFSRGPTGRASSGHNGPMPHLAQVALLKVNYGAPASHKTAMIILKPITPESVAIFKATRLAALQNTPLAFGSTYAKESQLSEEQWKQRVTQWNSDRSICYLSWDDGQPCGIAASFFDHDEPTKAHLVSMWVAPLHRQRGVGRLLVNGIIEWARQQGAQMLRLSVTSCNDAAIGFYQRLGFTKTGNTEPYPNDPALLEFEMIRPIEKSGAADV
jgi:ribosomal protein S18 acetylase RimI-like enzyme